MTCNIIVIYLLESLHRESMFFYTIFLRDFGNNGVWTNFWSSELTEQLTIEELKKYYF
jgi:hypothetical protein